MYNSHANSWPSNQGNTWGNNNWGNYNQGYGNQGYGNQGYGNNHQPMTYSSNPGGYSAGSIFGQNNQQNNNGILAWFMNNLSTQIWNLVNMGSLSQEYINPMMSIGKNSSNDYIRHIEQLCQEKCGTNIENARNEVIVEAFSNIISHIHQTIVNSQNRQIDNATNQNLSALYHGQNNQGNRFGGNNFGGGNAPQPMSMGYNNQPGYNSNPYGVSDSSDIPERYRTSNNQRNALQHQPSNNQVMDDPFARYAQPVDTHQPTAPVQPQPNEPFAARIKKANVMEIIGRANKTIRVKSNPFEEQHTSGWSSALSECAAEKVNSGEALTAASIMASSVFIEHGVDLPIKHEESAEVSRQCVINGANLGEEYDYRYNESVRPDTRIVDVTGDNLYGMETDEVSIIKSSNKGVDKTIVCADLIANDTTVYEDVLFETMRDGTIVDVAMSRGSEVHRCMSDSSDVAFTVTYNTMGVLDIPIAVMAPVYEEIQKLCTLHENISTFNTWYNELITILYDMPRGYSETLDELITTNINKVLVGNAFIFSDGRDQPTRISKLINVYDILDNSNILVLRAEHISKFKKIIFEVLKDIFGGELLNPDNSYAMDYILDNEVTSKAVIEYHKGAITSEDYRSWDDVADRDLIAKLSTNIRKFTAITMRSHALITTVQPAVKTNLTDWLFVYGDRSNHTTTKIDPMTMLIARTLDKFPTTTNVRFINRKTGGSMGTPIGDGIIGSTFDGYYGYMLTK